MKRPKWIVVLRWSVCLIGALLIGDFAHAQVGREERPITPAVVPPTTGMQTEIPPVVKIWTDKGNSKAGNIPVYYLGERIYISFQVDKDCYLTLYHIDSRGAINILFPNSYHTDNLVRGGRIYTFPTADYGYELVIRGPTGKEMLFVLASTHVYYHWQYQKRQPPVWPEDKESTSSFYGGYNPYLYDRYSYEDTTPPYDEYRLRLFEDKNDPLRFTLNKIKDKINLPATVACMTTKTQRDCECSFYATTSPY